MPSSDYWLCHKLLEEVIMHTSPGGIQTSYSFLWPIENYYGFSKDSIPPDYAELVKTPMNFSAVSVSGGGGGGDAAAGDGGGGAAAAAEAAALVATVAVTGGDGGDPSVFSLIMVKLVLRRSCIVGNTSCIRSSSATSS